MVREQATAIEFGRRIRAARMSLRTSQEEIASDIAVDRSLISRIELGRGGVIPLDTWAAVATAVGLRLDLRREMRLDAIDRGAACRETLAACAMSGGWRAVHAANETVMTRGQEHAVVHVWSTVTVVRPEIERLKDAMERHAANGLVLIPATGANRRRISESRDTLRDVFPTPGNRWYVALVSEGRRMPADPAILWMWPDCSRLRVAGSLPGWIWSKIGDGPRFATGRRRRR